MTFRGDTNTEIRKVKVNKVLQKLKNLFAGCWNARRVGRLVESVNYEVDWLLIRDHKYLFQALGQIGITRLFLAAVKIQVET